MAKSLKFGELINRVYATGIMGLGVGIGMSGVELSMGFFTGLPLAFSVGGIITAFAKRPIANRLSESEILDDQTPNYQSLLAQIPRSDQMIMAAFTIKNMPYSAIAVYPDSLEYLALLASGEAMQPEQIVGVADNGQVIFTLAARE
jgi:hypothetical protein